MCFFLRMRLRRFLIREPMAGRHDSSRTAGASQPGAWLLTAPETAGALDDLAGRSA